MLSTKSESMKPLLESTQGVHLTAYVKNTGDLVDLTHQLKNILDVADEYLVQAMSVQQIEKFISPIRILMSDSKRLKKFTNNLGIFRTQSSFRVLNIPVSVENTCIVADTFHVKPLLKWMQIDREFLLLGFDSGSATLYHGSHDTFKLVDTILFTDKVRAALTEERTEKCIRETMEWVNLWIMNLTESSNARLFVAGPKVATQAFFQTLKYENVSKEPVLPSFSQKKANYLCSEIRNVLKAEARKTFEKNLVEFHFATDSRSAKGNIFTIARAAVAGKIRKLLISDEIKIFGKLNRASGDLQIHHQDLDHEDDDILDDLAQLVLANGGEVIVASKNEIPRGRPVLAILEEQSQGELNHFAQAQFDFDRTLERGVV